MGQRADLNLKRLTLWVHRGSHAAAVSSYMLLTLILIYVWGSFLSPRRWHGLNSALFQHPDICLWVSCVGSLFRKHFDDGYSLNLHWVQFQVNYWVWNYHILLDHTYLLPPGSTRENKVGCSRWTNFTLVLYTVPAAFCHCMLQIL